MHIFQVLFGQIPACHNPDPIQWPIIISAIGGILVFSGVGATVIASVASTVVTMLVAGSSFETIAGATASLLHTISTINVSLELVARLVNAVKTILGC
ncbi:MAG: hypothetical protein KA716_18225 [Gloeotrichia echinulata DEX184]|nr:hypothetical protein [Gloeotrichia echinulata DEX184]